jgi:predicted dehydrogenase
MRAMQRRRGDGAARSSPRFIEVHRVSPMTFRSVDIGVVMDMMIHDLDVVLMLMGGREPDEHPRRGRGGDHRARGPVQRRLSGTAQRALRGEHHASRLALKTERVTRITGENAYIKIDYGQKTGTMIRRPRQRDPDARGPRAAPRRDGPRRASSGANW